MIVILQIILAFLALSLAFYNYFKSDSKEGQRGSFTFDHTNRPEDSYGLYDTDYNDTNTKVVDITEDLKQPSIWESITNFFNCG